MSMDVLHSTHEHLRQITLNGTADTVVAAAVAAADVCVTIIMLALPLQMRLTINRVQICRPKI